MTSYMYVSVSPTDVANHMRNDTDFAYEVLSNIAYGLDGDYEEYAEKLFKYVFEEEDDYFLFLLKAILDQFEHLAETE